MDFNSFEGAVYQQDTEQAIIFSFELHAEDADEQSAVIDEASAYNPSAIPTPNMRMDVSIVASGDSTRIEKVEVFEAKHRASFIMQVGGSGKVNSLSVDGRNINLQHLSADLYISQDNPLPSPYWQLRNPPLDARPRAMRLSPAFAIRLEVEKLLQSKVDRRTTLASLRRMLQPLFLLNEVSQEQIAHLATEATTRAAAKFWQSLASTPESETFQRLRSLLLVGRLPVWLTTYATALNRLIGDTLYIGPARAKSDRFYRYQDLSVSEIDPDGKNLPMFLNSLTDRQIKQFSEWVKGLFGYGVKIIRHAGQISIELTYKGRAVNVVDTGYGVSQILPVLGQVWWANHKPRSRLSRLNRQTVPLIAIEQPELHLHPAHQAILADAFVASIAPVAEVSGPRRLHFLIETHSEALINRLGALIAEGKLRANDVQILIFDNLEDENEETKVKTVEFSEDGFLIDWPFGFFTPDYTPGDDSNPEVLSPNAPAA